MRIAGAITVFVCCYYAGFLLSKGEQKAFNQLSGLIRLLDFMIQRITYSRENLGSLFSDFNERALEECGFLGLLNNPVGAEYDVVWSRAVSLLDVSESVKKELYLFGSQLGKTDFATQKERIEMCRNILYSIKKDMEPELDKKRKSIRALGGLIGAMIVIILF